MGEKVNDDGRDWSVEAVAAVSLAAGRACTLAPATTARLAGIDATPGAVRAIGAADLVRPRPAPRAAVVALAMARASPRIQSSPPCRWCRAGRGAPGCSPLASRSLRLRTSGPPPGSAPPTPDRPRSPARGPTINALDLDEDRRTRGRRSTRPPSTTSTDSAKHWGQAVRSGPAGSVVRAPAVAARCLRRCRGWRGWSEGTHALGRHGLGSRPRERRRSLCVACKPSTRQRGPRPRRRRRRRHAGAPRRWPPGRSARPAPAPARSAAASATAPVTSSRGSSRRARTP